MNVGFTKLHPSLIASSIWNESDSTRIVWITLLAMADQDGNVKASVGGLAHQARKTKEETEAALNILLSPDPDSSRKVLDGKRLIPIEGGWHLVNHDYYRELGMNESTKAYWREKKRKQRESKDVKDSPRQIGTYASASASVSASDLKEGSVRGEFDTFWKAYPKKVGKGAAERAFKTHKCAPIIAKIVNALAAQAKSDQWTKDGGQFIPHPTTWLNQHRWEDETTVAVQKPQQPHLNHLGNY
jgi:hypothetical protein